MAFELARPQVLICHRNLVGTSDRAPTTRLARAGVAAAEGGFGPSGTGGVAALRGSGAQRPDRRVACNSIVGPYCVSSKTGLN
jgi:hypothetical protein